MGLQISRVNHNGLLLAMFDSQSNHHPREDTLVAPPFPPVVQRLARLIQSRGVAPPLAIAIEEANATQHAPIVHAWLAMGLGEEWRKTRHLRIA